jgi:phospholipase C
VRRSHQGAGRRPLSQRAGFRGRGGPGAAVRADAARTDLQSSPRSYVWDATLTAGKYAFSVYGPDGFLTSFAGEVVPANLSAGPVPVVTVVLQSGATKTLELTLANEGHQQIVYTLTPNDYEGRTQTVTVKFGSPRTINWPANQHGYYDVVITTNTANGFRRRYAGRIA